MKTTFYALAACFALAACVPQDAATRSQETSASKSVVAASVDREFTCNPLSVRTDTQLRTVAGADTESLVLRPTGVACRNHLLYRDGAGHDRMLSHSPGMYLLADARTFGTTTLVCATSMQHDRSATPPDDPAQENRIITSTGIECAARQDGAWTQTNTLVAGGADWAAWAMEVGVEGNGVYWVRWTRDSTFQPLALSDEGRALDDGVYQTRFQIVRGRGPVELDTVKVSSTTVSVTMRGQ